MRALTIAAILWLPPATHANFLININAGSTLSANPAALAAFYRAAHSWEAAFSNDIGVDIDADLRTGFEAGVIGSTSAVMMQGGYTTVRNAMAAQGADPSKSIMANLPTAAQFTAFVPAGIGLSGQMALTKANAKALGFPGLSGSDATITFNSGFAFDYDNSDGVSPGTMDFETVAIHELGHALGFVSAVDTIDYLRSTSSTGNVALYPLDLYRFNPTSAPSTAGAFQTATRNLAPNSPAVFSDTTVAYSLSTGFYTGDRRQASHWKDDVLTSSYIGVLDPTLAYATQEPITPADIRALSLIGYTVAVPTPEPGTVTLLLSGGILVLASKHRKACSRP